MKKPVLVLILALFLMVSFATLPRNPLQNDDAALYALAAKNAIIYQSWLAQFVTPGDLSSFLDKPPLGIWLLAWFPKIFGVNELTIHFPNVIYYALLLVVMYFWLAKLSSKRLAFYSTLIAATSLCLAVYSRAPKLDVLLTFFVLIAHLSLYTFLKKDNPLYLIPFTLSLACGALTKSGFGILFPGLTILFLLIFNTLARKKLLNVLFTRYALLYSLFFSFIVGGILYAQRFALHDQWLPYLKSITIQSKYNVSYLGLGFHYSIIGFLLITIFPWTPLFLSSLKLRLNKLNLNTFCNSWFWSNVLFLLFFYQQNDLRTFTVFVPPLAILAGMRLLKLRRSPWLMGWQLFFLAIFSMILIAAIMNPVNPQGFSLKAAILPFALFTLSLIPLTSYLWKPKHSKFVITFALVCVSYSVLFYNTKPIADAFNPDLTWPGIIKEQRDKGAKFYIYRPPDRQLFYSPDLFWVDFMAGPADRYFWDKKELLKSLTKGKAIVLSDTKSWEKLDFKNVKVLAQDSYSRLILR